MSDTTEKSELDQQHKALTVSRIYFQSHLQAPEAQAYLAKRELNNAACRKFELGYAPDTWRGLVEHFKSHSVRLAAKDAGILTSPANSKRLLDFFRGRLIFPIHNAAGTLVGYGGRDITGNPDNAKYINTPETELFQKSQLLYGLHQNLRSIQDRREAVLVEGYMDVVRLTGAGFDIAVAPMGTALTSDQAQLLVNLGVRRLWICLDGDNAGEAATQRSVDVLMEHYHPALEVRLIMLSDGHDPDSLIQAAGADAFQVAMDTAQTLPDYIHAICTKGFTPSPCLEDKALYIQRIEPFIERSGGFLQDRLIDRACRFTGLSKNDLFSDKVNRQENDAVSQWHPLVTLAARWMLFDENPSRIASRMAKLTIPGSGLQELADLAKQVIGGEATTGLMHQYAKAHGPLLPEELDELAESWGRWHKNAALEHQLTILSKMPFDQSAKEAVRSITGSMRQY
ncbi:DNA primase [Pseudomonas sp.]|uniref:DNA primase n=1 Tax=Pseudomonas sp. TaxID=306 RepID=UPI00290F14EE|nr:toprim domain-containing protein [Pseudomonas sp.]MDU4254420.1 toprim domain-containing protein [Pseudomonas sp.]